MIAQLLITVIVLTGLMFIYFLIQRRLRRTSPEVDDDSDVLEMRWGCGHCGREDRRSCLLRGACKEDLTRAHVEEEDRYQVTH